MRKQLLIVSILLCAALSLAGCASQTTPPAVPTTGPSGNTAEDQAYQFAQGTLQLLEEAATAAEAVPGVVPAQDAALITLAESKANLAMSQWAAVLDQPADTQLKAAFFDALGDLLPLVTKATTNTAAAKSVAATKLLLKK